MRPILLSFLILHLAACSSFQTVAIRDVRAGDEHSPVQVGDVVEVETFDNENLQFPVLEITADGISGRFGFVRYDDIRALRVRQTGTANSEAGYWILGVLGLAAAIALVASADSVTVCSGTPCPNDPD